MTKPTDSTLEVRPYEQEDFPAVVGFIAMQKDAEREILPIRRQGGLVAVPYAHHICSQCTKADGALFIAALAKAPIGFIAGWPSEDEDDLLEEEARIHGYVSDIYVLPNWRRMGVAEKLLAKLEAHFRNLNITRLRIGGLTKNETATALYQNCGFRAHETVFEKQIAMPTHHLVGGSLVQSPKGAN